MISAQYVDVLPFVAELMQLHDLTAVAPTEHDLERVRVFCDDLVERLVTAAPTDTPPSDDATWVATKTPETVIVVGPGLFLLASSDESTVSVVSEGASWTFGPDASGTQISYADDTTQRTWTLLPGGVVVDMNDTDALERRVHDITAEAVRATIEEEAEIYDNATAAVVTPAPSPTPPPIEKAPHVPVASAGAATSVATAAAAVVRRAEPSPTVAWRPTHRVGPHALPVGAVAVGTFEPGTSLDAGLPVRLLDANANGWAFVECSNGWQCYVAAWGILPIDGADNG